MDKLPGYPILINLRNSLALFTILLFLAACSGDKSTSLPPSTGRPGELLVIIDTSDWKGNLGSSIKEAFAESYPGLPQDEPYFNVIHIVPRAFTNIFKTTSNILTIEIDKNATTAFARKENVWATDQLYVKIIAKDKNEAARIIDKNKESLQRLFLETDYKRIQRTIKNTAGAEQKEVIVKALGIDVDIPKDFKQILKSDNSVYFRRERAIREHYVIQSLLCYSVPYTDTLDLETGALVKQRDSITKLMVKGSNTGEYMQVYKEYPPDEWEYSHDGHYAKEIRGLWKMKGAFMGGPFIHFAMVDEERSLILCLDGFVYAPKFDKREYIKELESIIKTVHIVKEKQLTAD